MAPPIRGAPDREPGGDVLARRGEWGKVPVFDVRFLTSGFRARPGIGDGNNLPGDRPPPSGDDPEGEGLHTDMGEGPEAPAAVPGRAGTDRPGGGGGAGPPPGARGRRRPGRAGRNGKPGGRLRPEPGDASPEPDPGGSGSEPGPEGQALPLDKVNLSGERRPGREARPGSPGEAPRRPGGEPGGEPTSYNFRAGGRGRQAGTQAPSGQARRRAGEGRHGTDGPPSSYNFREVSRGP